MLCRDQHEPVSTAHVQARERLGGPRGLLSASARAYPSKALVEKKEDQQARKARLARAGRLASVSRTARDARGIAGQAAERKPACWRSGTARMRFAQWCAPRPRQQAGSRLRSPAAEASGASINNSESVSSSSAQSLCTFSVCHNEGSNRPGFHCDEVEFDGASTGGRVFHQRGARKYASI